MGMGSINLRLENGSQVAIPNSQVEGSVVIKHSVRNAEPLDLRLSLPRMKTDSFVQLKGRDDELLLEEEDLGSTEAQLDHALEGWLLQFKGVGSLVFRVLICPTGGMPSSLLCIG